MTLARAAATRAAADIATPAPTLPIPCSAAAALEQAEHAARHRAPDYGRLFTHLTRAIRQTMLLETHIAEGPTRTTHHLPQHDTATPEAGRDAPRCETPRFDRPSPDMPRRDTLERLDCALPIAATGEIPVEDLLQATGKALGAGITPTPNPHSAPPTQQQRSGAAPSKTATRHTGRRW